MRIEIACFNALSAIIAAGAGADRIELCDSYTDGGTTPDLETVKAVRAQTKAELFVMIRPRGGDFLYSAAEFAEMRDSIQSLKAHVDGFVFGILNDDHSVNTIQNKQLVALADPLPCTFHRALDKTTAPIQALEDVIACGFSTILTSGTKANVIAGKHILRSLVNAAKDRVTIMPGGGLRSTNLEELHQAVGAAYYHSSAITGSAEIADAAEIMALKNFR